ncbi:MAG: hypothetical protein R2713_19820 [Ilumatobacteraceae bacterium]
MPSRTTRAAAATACAAIGPGRAVGEARTMLLEHARTHGAPTHDEAVELLRTWWAARSS